MDCTWDKSLTCRRVTKKMTHGDVHNSLLVHNVDSGLMNIKYTMLNDKEGGME